MPRRSVDHLKPTKFKDYYTLSEVSEKLDKAPSWIRLLEQEARIPVAQRVKRGKVSIRLWSPAQVDEIAAILSRHRRGRPRKHA